MFTISLAGTIALAELSLHPNDADNPPLAFPHNIKLLPASNKCAILPSAVAPAPTSIKILTVIGLVESILLTRIYFTFCLSN